MLQRCVLTPTTTVSFAVLMHQVSIFICFCANKQKLSISFLRTIDEQSSSLPSFDTKPVISFFLPDSRGHGARTFDPEQANIKDIIL